MDTKKIFSLITLALLALVIACTPKTTEQAKTEEPEEVKKPPVVQQEGLSECKKFSDNPNSNDAETAHVLYRDFLKQKDYDQAFKYWKTAYAMAPAADGMRDYHFLDGVKLYENMLSKETDDTKKGEYIDTILAFYDEAASCYPKKATMYQGLKAFKLYYNYRDRTDDMEIYNQFKNIIDTDGKKTADFVVNPFTATMMELFVAQKITQAEVKKYASKINEIVAYGTTNCKAGKECDRWDIVKGYAPVRLEELEGVEGFYDCDYYKAKYLPEYEANPSDCEMVSMAYGRLKWGKCPEVDAALQKLKPEIDRCFPPVVTSTGTPKPTCASKVREGDYTGALTCYEDKASASSDNNKKAAYYLMMAKIYYGQLKKYSKARTYAQKAADARPGWGEPHILIGKLYASSGPLCGPGRGFDSQVVTWVAIDEWNKAKRDPEFASEANRLIGKYAQYMPSKEDIFQRSISEGSTYKVGCWIQRSTKVRVAK